MRKAQDDPLTPMNANAAELEKSGRDFFVKKDAHDVLLSATKAKAGDKQKGSGASEEHYAKGGGKAQARLPPFFQREKTALKVKKEVHEEPDLPSFMG